MHQGNESPIPSFLSVAVAIVALAWASRPLSGAVARRWKDALHVSVSGNVASLAQYIRRGRQCRTIGFAVGVIAVAGLGMLPSSSMTAICIAVGYLLGAVASEVFLTRRTESSLNVVGYWDNAVPDKRGHVDKLDLLMLVAGVLFAGFLTVFSLTKAVGVWPDRLTTPSVPRVLATGVSVIGSIGITRIGIAVLQARRRKGASSAQGADNAIWLAATYKLRCAGVAASWYLVAQFFAELREERFVGVVAFVMALASASIGAAAWFSIDRPAVLARSQITR